MIRPAGTVAQAMQLAKERWAQMWWFDLDPATWESFFAQYPPGVVIQAVKLTRSTNDRREPVIYRSLLYWLDKIASGDSPNR